MGCKVAFASLYLEHLAAFFFVDARHFFTINPCWEWPNLTSLVLTSGLLRPDENETAINTMPRGAATVVSENATTENMEIWNGSKGFAALFRYQTFNDTRGATIVWRGTWPFFIRPPVMRDWGAVVRRRYGEDWRLDWELEQLDGRTI